jgi:hypothetical protein
MSNNKLVTRYSKDRSYLVKYNQSNWDTKCKLYFEKSDINVDEFYGDVLYVGMGNAWGPRNQSSNVKTTTIIEKFPDIIEKYNIPDKNWNIILDDAYTVDLNDTKYDIIFIDIFAWFIEKEEFLNLYSKYSQHLQKNGTIHYIKTLPVKENGRVIAKTLKNISLEKIIKEINKYNKTK